jgi:hypothetical protein
MKVLGHHGRTVARNAPRLMRGRIGIVPMAFVAILASLLACTSSSASRGASGATVDRSIGEGSVGPCLEPWRETEDHRAASGPDNTIAVVRSAWCSKAKLAGSDWPVYFVFIHEIGKSNDFITLVLRYNHHDFKLNSPPRVRWINRSTIEIVVPNATDPTITLQRKELGSFNIRYRFVGSKPQQPL